MYAVDIKWEEAGLPITVEVPIQLTEMEDIGTWLSYKYACQHDGFRLVESFKKIVNELLEVLEEVSNCMVNSSYGGITYGSKTYNLQ